MSILDISLQIMHMFGYISRIIVQFVNKQIVNVMYAFSCNSYFGIRFLSYFVTVYQTYNIKVI